MSEIANLVGDKYDTIAAKIVADAELDEMRGSVIQNLTDEIADALRTHADRIERLEAALRELLDQIEDTELHGGGADDHDCPICKAMRVARALLSTAEKKE